MPIAYRLLLLLLSAAPALAARSVWQTTLGKPAERQVFQTVVELPDGGWLAGGYYDLPVGYSVPFLARAGSDGAWQWTEHYPGSAGSTGVEALYAAADHYLAASTENTRLRLQRLRPDGTEARSRTLELPGNTHILKIIADGAGGYYLGGYRQGNGGVYFLVLRVDAALDLRWEKAFATTTVSFATHCRLLQLLPGGDLLAGGRLGRESALYRLSPQGDARWGKPLLGTSNSSPAMRDWVLTADQTLLITGEIPFNGGSNRAVLWSVDTDGNELEEFPLDFIPTGHQRHAYGERLRLRPDGLLDLFAQERDSSYRAVIDREGRLAGALTVSARLPQGVQLRPYNLALGADRQTALAGFIKTADGGHEAALHLYNTALDKTQTLMAGDGLSGANEYPVAVETVADRPWVWAQNGFGNVERILTAYQLAADGAPLDSFQLTVPAYREVEIIRVKNEWWVLTLEYADEATAFYLRRTDDRGRAAAEPRWLLDGEVFGQIGQRRFLLPLTDGRVLFRLDTTGYVLDATGTPTAEFPPPPTDDFMPLNQNLVVALPGGGWVMGTTEQAGIRLRRYAPDTRMTQQRLLSADAFPGYQRSALVFSGGRLVLLSFFDEFQETGTLRVTHLDPATLAVKETYAQETAPMNVFYPVFEPSVAKVKDGYIWLAMEGGNFYRIGPDNEVLNLSRYFQPFYHWLPLSVNRYLKVHSQSHRGQTDVRVSGYHLEIARPAVSPDTLDTVLIFPNPADDFINVRLPTAYRGSLTARLTDALGRRLSTEQTAYLEAGESMTFSVTKLPAGVYYLVLDYNGLRETRPVYVQ